MLFAAFEKHQYYNIKDLVKLTNQPVVINSIIIQNFIQNLTFYIKIYLDVLERNLERILQLQPEEPAQKYVGAQGWVPPLQVRRR